MARIWAWAEIAAWSGMGAVMMTGAIAITALAQDTRYFRIGTGPTESTYFSVGGGVASLISNPPGSRDCERGGSCGVPGLIAVAQTTAGALATIDAIRGHQLESGFTPADIAYWAFHGIGPYKDQGAVTELRAIANLYPESMHVVVRRDSPISSIGDLRGKIVSLGEKESGTLIEALVVLEAFGVAEAELRSEYLKPGVASDRLSDGTLDAYFELAPYPATTISDLAKATEIRLLPIKGAFAEKLGADYPFLTADTIPAGVYQGVPDTETLSVATVWVVSSRIDDALVYGVTRALWHANSRRILDTLPRGRSIRQPKALDDLAIPLHAGASLYYFESGMVR